MQESRRRKKNSLKGRVSKWLYFGAAPISVTASEVRRWEEPVVEVMWLNLMWIVRGNSLQSSGSLWSFVFLNVLLLYTRLFLFWQTWHTDVYPRGSGSRSIIVSWSRSQNKTTQYYRHPIHNINQYIFIKKGLVKMWMLLKVCHSILGFIVNKEGKHENLKVRTGCVCTC